MVFMDDQRKRLLGTPGVTSRTGTGSPWSERGFGVEAVFEWSFPGRGSTGGSSRLVAGLGLDPGRHRGREGPHRDA
ncbi:hypothetical protein FHU35_1191 [Saccharopolyspora dendranthemae]|uniref:Uncharacterized protein n=1 Tax=Saccharopolyspora dendranthemae TaxID=1181886 RepID=A0A561V781_9PSEU|nr:hypothetical protein FHU35_1191 [Saccharopolyspora dendranthemae]